MRLVLPVVLASLTLLQCISPPETSRSPAFARDVALCAQLDRMEIHAHRGAWDRPENQMTALLRGIELGADRVEFDLQVSKEDRAETKDEPGEAHLVVAHDVYFRENSCIDKDGRPVKGRIYFRELRLDEIKTYDCGSIVPPDRIAVPGEKTSTLDEVLAAFLPVTTSRGVPANLNIEVKYYDSLKRFYPKREVYADLLLKAIKKSGIDQTRLMVQSFDVPFLRILRQKNETLMLSPLLHNATNAVGIAEALKADLITPEMGQVNPQMLTRLHAANIRVIPFTVNGPNEMIRLARMGVDGLITDRPDLFGQIKKYHCSH